MNAVIRLLLKGMFVYVVCLGHQRSALPADTMPIEAEKIEIPNPEFENRGEGWMLSEHGNWEPSAGRDGNACPRIKSNSEAEISRCVLLTPGLSEMGPGMKIRITFHARWLAGGNKVYAGFHEDRPYWINEPPAWGGEIPVDGKSIDSRWN